uniref:DDE Tnp4 domain-containing protein n=1 Tax=Lactuca sativa TaxID=4236 RepID=A0A9R1WHX8_LACSA|nr:hypothetical protein LSAT_V11C200056340 [Lactuca sativa]
MRRPLFKRILYAVTMFDPYYQSNRDCTGRQSLSSIQKCTAAMRTLAYGVAADAVDGYLHIAETTTIKCVKKFVKVIISVFGDEYLRRPTVEDLQRLLHVGHEQGFPGMLGSIDCMHWELKNCLVAWHGQYASGDHKSTLNDINMLDRSPIFHELLEVKAPKINFQVNGNNYNLGPKHALFAKKQEAARKDVERAFGILQARFAIISGPSRMWCKEIIRE